MIIIIIIKQGELAYAHNQRATFYRRVSAQSVLHRYCRIARQMFEKIRKKLKNRKKSLSILKRCAPLLMHTSYAGPAAPLRDSRTVRELWMLAA
jgi:hypothetical protein